jgi:hypothetical protein
MKIRAQQLLVITCLGVIMAGAARAETPRLEKSSAATAAGAIGIRLGAGADITGGVAYGGQLDYTMEQTDNALELGLAFFGGKFTEDSDNGYEPGSSAYNEYHEETTVVVIAAIANYLIRYAAASGPYFVVGAGVGAVSVEWTETSATDTTLGPRWGTGSKQSEDGTAAGGIINFGIGHRLSDRFDLRLQVPTFFISGGEERDGGIVPTVTLTAGLKF